MFIEKFEKDLQKAWAAQDYFKDHNKIWSRKQNVTKSRA